MGLSLNATNGQRLLAQKTRQPRCFDQFITAAAMLWQTQYGSFLYWSGAVSGPARHHL